MWPRRQAHEINVHRRDAELAAGLEPAAMDPELASDGIDEYFELVRANTVYENRILATQKAGEELLINLRGQVYRIR